MSFAADAFGTVAFAESADVTLDPSGFQAFLDDVGAARCWLLEVDAFSLASVTTRAADFGDAGFGELGFADGDSGVTGGVSTLRFSDRGYISKIYTAGVAGGDPDYPYHYDGRLTGRIRVERSIAGKDGLGGLASVTADVELLNGDGGLDDIPVNYAIDGRRAQLFVGRPTDQRADFGLVLSGVVQADGTSFGLNTATLRLSDGAAKLDRVVNATTYLGTGGTEGGTDLKGKPKPKCFGYAKNFSPPLVDSANLIYQVHDGAISDVPQAYDRGVALTKVAGAPGAGEYQVTVATGTFKLGATPAGTVTCNALGDASGSGFVSATADICLRLISLAGLTSSEVDATSFANLASDQPAPVGIWIGSEETRTVSDCLDQLLSGIGAFGGFNRVGALSVGRIEAAAADAPAASFTQQDILNIEREALPAPVNPIAWRASCAWQPNYTVQSDLAASVTAARRTFAAAAVRVSKSDDPTIRSRNLLAKEYTVASLFDVATDADAEALRLFNLWGVRRGLYRVTLPIKALTRDLGQVIGLEHPRFGLSMALQARVLGCALVDPKTVELRVLV